MKRLPVLMLLAYSCGCGKPDKAVTASATAQNYRIADSLLRLRNDDSAFYYYNLVANTSTHWLEKAAAYNRMALLQFNSGDHYGCQETITESLRLLSEKRDTDRYYLLSNYNLLGRSYFEQANYEAAISSYDKAATFLAEGQFYPTLLNNLAMAYQKKKDYDKAKSLFQTVLDKSLHDTLGYARTLSNLARTKWLEDPAYRAAPELLTAMHVREMKNDRTGLNASYLHLADYYAGTHPDSSLYYAKKMYAVAQSPDDVLEAIEKIMRVGSVNDLRDYSAAYFKINDSLKLARSTARNQFAAIRFETEKNKAENLQLQNDNIRQRILIYGITASFVILAALGIAWYRRRKRRIEQATQERIREHELKTSKKVHDVVANGLYRIMTDLEHRDTLDKEPLLDKIEVLYEQSRDISYDQPAHQAEDYARHIHQLLSSFGTDSTKIFIAGNQERTWNKLTAQEKTELEYVLQELMVNMSKHSRAGKVVIRFTEADDVLGVHYKDDGVGFPPGFKPGNGLRNTENRIKNLGGRIIFDGKNGVKIEISLPICKVND